mgnify:CR=1 FL=1
MNASDEAQSKEGSKDPSSSDVQGVQKATTQQTLEKKPEEKLEEKKAEEKKPPEKKAEVKKTEEKKEGGISIPFFGKKKEEQVIEYLFDPIPEVKPTETYWIEEPYAKILVVPMPERGGQSGYFVDEVKLTDKEEEAFRKLRDILSKELAPPKDMTVDAKDYVVSESKRLIKKYSYIMGAPTEESTKRIEYYIRRDLIGYGPVNPVVEDRNIEDISCDGVGRPVFVWHKKYESLPTNLKIMDRPYFNDFIIKLAHFAGRHISTAFPIVDAMLPGKHRLAATYGEEVSTFGSTFTIRKFREEPFSIVDLIELGTINPALAAYFWFLLDNRLTVMIMGGTGAGKTSYLNALTNLFRPGLKIVSVEETAELNMPHENWVQFVSRESYGLGASKIGEVTLFDLVKTSLRYRPDYIIVGEIRGEEAFVLFQAMATGHGGISTIHAENLEYAIKRMTSPPMNIARPYIPLMNVACLVERVALPRKREGLPFGRRVRQVWEVRPDGSYDTIAFWDPIEDAFTVSLDKTVHLPNICLRQGMPRDWYIHELQVREAVIKWMIDNNIHHFKEVARTVTQFHVKRRKA